MTGRLVMANAYAPGLPHHGATFAFDPEVDPNGLAAWAALVSRFAAKCLLRFAATTGAR